MGVQLPPTSDLKTSDLVTAHFADNTTGGAEPDQRKGAGEGRTWYLLFGDTLSLSSSFTALFLKASRYEIQVELIG